jgi:threonine dehydratase
MLTLVNFLRTKSLIEKYLKTTPLVFSEYYSEKLRAQIWLKLDILQPTGTFKVRGAFSKLLRLTPEERKHGVVSASGGNHGMGVAYAAQKLQIPAWIYMPKSAPASRVQTAKSLGANVILEGEVLDDAANIAKSRAAKDGLTYVHPFVDPFVQLGQGTMGIEIYEQFPELDAVVASMGGGGLISGLGAIFKAMKAEVKVWGVETVGADCIHQSLEAGRPVKLAKITSIAESLGALTTNQETFVAIQKYVDATCVVTDEEALRTLVEMLFYQKLLIEPAAACSMASLNAGKFGDISGKKVVVILCGASVEPGLLKEWIAEFRPDLSSGGPP